MWLFSSVTNKEEVMSSPDPTSSWGRDIGNFPAPVSSKGKVRGLNKQTTIDDSELKEPAIKDIRRVVFDWRRGTLRNHLTYKSPNSSFSGFKDSSKDSLVETSGGSIVTEVPSDKISLDIPSRKKFKWTRSVFWQRPQFFNCYNISLPTRIANKKSIFSFLTGSEKSENRASTAPQNKISSRRAIHTSFLFPHC